MNQLDLIPGMNRRAEKSEDDGASAKEKAARANKFLEMAHMKQAFAFSFEGMFLDMFKPSAEIQKPVEAPKIEAPRREEAPRDDHRQEAPAPVQVSHQEVRSERRVERPAEKPQKSGDDQRAAEQLPRQDGAEIKEIKTEKKQSVEIQAPKELKDETKVFTAEVKIVHLELEAHLQKNLSAEDMRKFIKEIKSLLSDEDISLEDLVAGSMKVLEDLVGKLRPIRVEVSEFQFTGTKSEISQAVSDILDMGSDMENRGKKKFLKSLLGRLQQLLENALDGGEKQTDAKKGDAMLNADSQNDKKVDDAIMKLMKRVDKPERIDLPKSDLDRPQVEVKNEGESEDEKLLKKLKDGKNEKNREEKAEVKVKDSLEPQKREVDHQVQIDRSTRTAPVDVTKGGGKERSSEARENPGQTIKNVSEVGRSAKSSEGNTQNQNQQSWQNSYNQSSSLKGMERSENAQQSKQNSSSRPMPNAVFDQIVQNAKITLQNGKSEATIQLKPEFLGKVEMKVTVEENQAKVKFAVESNAVKTAIMENIADLKKTLAEQGIEVKDVEVTIKNEMGEDDSGQNRNRGEERDGAADYGDGKGYFLDDGEEFEIPERVTREEVDGATVRYVA